MTGKTGHFNYSYIIAFCSALRVIFPEYSYKLGASSLTTAGAGVSTTTLALGG